MTSGHSFHFGSFSLYPASRLLLDNGQPVRLGARALDLLIALVEQSGEVISKEALFQRVWPSTIVEETSLRVHIAALRKALGGPDARFIANIPGKGYSFTGEISARVADVPVGGQLAAGRSTRHNLPLRLTRMIGRSATAEGVASVLLTQRFVTITGEGGVGKTTLALAVAEANLDEYADGAAFVDLASCSGPSLLVSTIGRAIGMLLPAHAPTRLVADALRGQQFLLLLDNCEHLVAQVAVLVTELLGQLPMLRILATSREPLRADGEHVHRLETLSVPPQSSGISADDALRFDAIQLLVERVVAATDDFLLSNADAPFAAELCRRLDGIPLAIELAAARVGFFGLQGLVRRLPDRLQILANGHRTVMPRHQTLRALYDWSFDLLDPASQQAFARLAVFPDSFSLDGGLAMMPCADRATALPMLLDLIAKSLVATDVREDRRRYRLLDTTRVYALEKLTRQGGLDEAKGLHARTILRFLEQINQEREHHSRPAWTSKHGPLVPDILAALDWTGQADGEVLLHAQLAEHAYLLFQELSQLELLRPHLQAALDALRRLPMPPRALQDHLTVLLGEALSHCTPHRGVAEHWLDDARELLSQPDAPPSAFFAACAMNLSQGDYRLLLRFSERLELSAEYTHNDDCIIIGRRFQAQARHYLGHFATARRLAEEVIQHPRPVLRRGIVFDNVDRRVSMGIILARTAWLEGNTLEAERFLALAGEQVEHELERAQCQYLGMAAIPMALWTGDTARAGLHLAALQQLVERPNLGDFWTGWAQAYAELIQGRLPQAPIHSAMLLDIVGTLAPGFSDERMLARALSGLAGWSAAEVLRHQGERIAGQAPADAQRLFEKSLSLARDQGAARWELRAALSLVRLSLRLGRLLVPEPALLSPLARLRTATPDPDALEAARLMPALAALRLASPASASASASASDGAG